MAVLLGAFALARFGRGKPLADSALIGMGSAFPNSGFIGYPIVLQWLGPPAAVGDWHCACWSRTSCCCR